MVYGHVEDEVGGDTKCREPLAIRGAVAAIATRGLVAVADEAVLSRDAAVVGDEDVKRLKLQVGHGDTCVPSHVQYSIVGSLDRTHLRRSRI